MSGGNGHDDEWNNLGSDVHSFMSNQFLPVADEEPKLEDPRNNEQFRIVWDELWGHSDTRPIIEYINGSPCEPIPSLTDIVRAFFESSWRPGREKAIVPQQVSAVIAFCGGQMSRLHNLRDEVIAIWGGLTKEYVGKVDQKAADHKADEGWLAISDEPWDANTLPPRPWLAAPYLMREEITLLHGPGAAGKSQLCVAWAAALALGRPFGRLLPQQRSRVLLTNFEDNATEQKRRISAMLQTFNATPADLQGWLYRVSLGPNGDATMFEVDEFGQVQTTSCWNALETACQRIKPDAVFADPLVAINAVPENNNQLMRRVMTMMRTQLAQKFKCALIPAHHDNKSGNDDEDSDQSNVRGGTDIVNAARFELATKKMTTPQAEEWDIDPERRGFYFRVGSVASKRNYTAPEEAEWFERLALPVGGEQVVFCTPWQPPSDELASAPTSELNAALDAIRDGPKPGTLYRASRQGGAGNWVGNVLIEAFRTSEKQAKHMVKEWIKSGLLFEEEYYHPVWKRRVAGLRVDDSRRPT